MSSLVSAGPRFVRRSESMLREKENMVDWESVLLRHLVDVAPVPGDQRRIAPHDKIEHVGGKLP